MPDWSLLPSDLLQLIVGRLETSLQIVLFRSVCRSWRSVVLSPRNSRRLGPKAHIPMFISFYYRGRPRFGSDVKYCTLRKIPIFLLRFKTPFGDDYLLAAMEERKSEKSMLMWSPLAMYSITAGRNEMLFNSLTSQIVPFGHYYQINMEMQTETDKWARSAKRVEYLEHNTEDGRDFTLLVNMDGHLMKFRSHDMSWAEISVSPKKCDDVVSFKGKFYVVDKSGWGHVFVFEPSSKVSEIPSVTGSTERASEESLVQSGDELLLVQQFIPGEYLEEHMHTWFKVFRLDEKGGMRKWVQVNDLNDRVIFLGPWLKLCCSVQKFPGAKENCIVFVSPEDVFIDFNESVLVFDLRTRRTRTAFSECRGYMGAFGENLESLASCGVVTMANPETNISDLLSKPKDFSYPFSRFLI